MIPATVSNGVGRDRSCEFTTMAGTAGRSSDEAGPGKNFEK